MMYNFMLVCSHSYEMWIYIPPRTSRFLREFSFLSGEKYFCAKILSCSQINLLKAKAQRRVREHEIRINQVKTLKGIYEEVLVWKQTVPKLSFCVELFKVRIQRYRSVWGVF